jgi:hypothetical protein
MENPEWNECVSQVSTLIENKEKYQRLLAKNASIIKKNFGTKALVDFALEVSEQTGRKISPTTLRNYAWVSEKIEGLNLPEDLSFNAYQAIAGSKDPLKWATEVHNSGLSSGEIIRFIKIEKGIKDKKKETICPACGATIQV